MWFSGERIQADPVRLMTSFHGGSAPFDYFFPSPPPPGLRGAIPYALSLHLGLEPIEKRQLIGTTTIIIVLFTILLLGGGTMPLIRIMDIEESQSRRKNMKDINLSKTEKMVMNDTLRFSGTQVGAPAGRAPPPDTHKHKHIFPLFPL